MTDYYVQNLSGRRLQRCYDLASPRVRQYLEAEVRHVLRRLRPGDSVLELGCGYGRIAERLAAVARHVVGIDVALESLRLGRHLFGPTSGCQWLCSDALALSLSEATFDVVVCLQNGICAFGVDPVALVQEALRVTRRGGRVILSSYADSFWPERLAWFEAQAAEGLVGAIDHDASREGVIVCADGFRAARMTPEGFRSVCDRVGVDAEIFEVDGSCVFCEIVQENPASIS